MTWFARSIANTFKLDDDEDNSPQSPGRGGVKEDLSEITKTLTRQFWGVASFISPPLPAEQSNGRPESSDPEASAPEAIDGIRRDFAEIRGKFRSGITKLSNNIDVSEITKLASNFLQLESEDDDSDSTDGDGDGAVGVTDEVVAFASDIAMHPETWLDFPLPEDEDNNDKEFDLSDAQQEHALAVERLAPRLGALRIELCPSYMSESSFWKIYFVLLHPRLEILAAKLLSTPKIVKARALLTRELNNHSYSENMPDSKSESAPLEVSAIETVKHPIHIDEIQIVDKSVIKEKPHEGGKDEDDWLKEESSEIITNNGDTIPIEPLEVSAIEIVKHPIHIDEIQIVDKSVIKEKPHEEGKDEDDWLKEESSEIVTNNGDTIPIENDEDLSFSDLEDDDDDDDDDDDSNIPIHYKKTTYGSDSSTKDSVQLGKSSTDSGKDRVYNSEMKESNDWLDVVDIDVA